MASHWDSDVFHIHAPFRRGEAQGHPAGPPGVGKTHLAIALGIAATNAGYRTLFTSAADLVASVRPPNRRLMRAATVPRGKAS